MGTTSFRSYFILLFTLIAINNHVNAARHKITLNSLFTHPSSPSINFALKQIASSASSMDIILELNTTEAIVPVSSYQQTINLYFISLFFSVMLVQQ